MQSLLPERWSGLARSLLEHLAQRTQIALLLNQERTAVLKGLRPVVLLKNDRDSGALWALDQLTAHPLVVAWGMTLKQVRECHPTAPFRGQTCLEEIWGQKVLVEFTFENDGLIRVDAIWPEAETAFNWVCQLFGPPAHRSRHCDYWEHLVAHAKGTRIRNRYTITYSPPPPLEEVI